MSINKGLMSSNRADWETPQNLFNELDRQFYFTLDAAANEQNAKHENFYTIEDDALTKAWEGRVWLNPPYGRSIGAWVRKAYVSGVARAEIVVCLLPARTDTKYFHDTIMLATEIRLIKGRLKFVGAPSAAPFPSMIVIFDRNSGRQPMPWFYSANTIGQRIGWCQPGANSRDS